MNDTINQAKLRKVVISHLSQRFSGIIDFACVQKKFMEADPSSTGSVPAEAFNQIL